MSRLTSYSILNLQFKKRFYLFLERGEGWRKREGDKHQLVFSCSPPNGDLACNPGRCPDRESNQWPSGSQAGVQCTEPHQTGLSSILNGYFCQKKITFKNQSFVFSHLCKLLDFRIGREIEPIILIIVVEFTTTLVTMNTKPVFLAILPTYKSRASTCLRLRY